MTSHNGWRSARGHIVFLLALVTAFAVVYGLEQWETGGATATTAQAWSPDPSTQAPPPPYEDLSEGQVAQARSAWAYFQANTRPETGLVDSVADYPATTMWDTGSYLIAAIAAERLGLLPRAEFDDRMAQALDSLARMPLYDGRLPNKSYDTTSLAMTDYANTPTEAGIGWSALDMARVLVPLGVLLRHYPQQAEAVQRVLDRWDLDAAVQDGVLMGALPAGDGYDLVQEGRLGYEQYGAKGFALLGYDVQEAARVESHLGWAEVHGVEVPVDTRDPEELGAHAYTLSEPYVLAGLEYGWDTRLRDLAWRVYRAQEMRHEETGQLTAVTEDHLDRDPRFVFSAVVANGTPWAVLTPDGEDAEEFRILSAKAAMGWNALYRTPYTEELVEAIEPLRTPDGWQAGLYEPSGEPNAVLTANTNAVILSALHYWAFGPLLHPRDRSEDTASAGP